MEVSDFQNTSVAFSIRSNRELKWAYWMFRLLSYTWLVSLANSVMMFFSRMGFPINWLVKPTVYKQFVGGEIISECEPVIERLAGGGVKSILDYSVEGEEDDEDIEKAHAETMRVIDFAGKHPDIPFAVFKPTAFIRSSSLEILSEYPEKATEAVKADGEKFMERVDRLCSKAYGYDLPVLIDAEDSFYQSFIDETVYRMQKKYNADRAIVFNTYQMYRWDRVDILKRDIQRAREEKFFLGAKFVRGAYMERERERARLKGYKDPIQPDKEATDRDYNLGLKISVENIDIVSVFNGTHNEYSSAYLTQLMKDQGIEPGDDRLWFSQLYGMSDHISFNLAGEGYNVAKYVPYGPVKHVLPYLTRRAEENTSVKGQTGRELGLISAELKRRRQNR